MFLFCILLWKVNGCSPAYVIPRHVLLLWRAFVLFMQLHVVLIGFVIGCLPHCGVGWSFSAGIYCLPKGVELKYYCFLFWGVFHFLPQAQELRIRYCISKTSFQWFTKFDDRIAMIPYWYFFNIYSILFKCCTFRAVALKHSRGGQCYSYWGQPTVITVHSAFHHKQHSFYFLKHFTCWPQPLCRSCLQCIAIYIYICVCVYVLFASTSSNY